MTGTAGVARIATAGIAVLLLASCGTVDRPAPVDASHDAADDTGPVDRPDGGPADGPPEGPDLDGSAGPDGADADDAGDAAPDHPGQPGDPCQSIEACVLGNCLAPERGGSCTDFCDVSTCVSSGDLCVGGLLCLPACASDADCRPGFLCTDRPSGVDAPAGKQVCWPGDRSARLGDACDYPSSCDAGQACRCRPGACSIFDPAPRPPGSLCTRECEVTDAASCGDDAACLPDPLATTLGGTCARRCTGDTDCPSVFACTSRLDGTGQPVSVCLAGRVDARLGDRCQGDLDCEPGFGLCLTEAETGLPGGYCSRQCIPGSGLDSFGCAAGEECLAPAFDGDPLGGRCVRTCSGDGDCSDLPGYSCTDGIVSRPSDSTVCAPGLASSVPVGHDCLTAADCTAGRQLCAGLPLGYSDAGFCSNLCDPGACGAQELCTPTRLPASLCVQTCTVDADCAGARDPSTGELACSDVFGFATQLCLPYASGATLGDPCRTFADCPDEGYCQDQLESRAPIPGGYCSMPCDATLPDACGADAVCVAPGFCARRCKVDSDCRADEGFSCLGDAPDRFCYLPLGL
jgi:hypothetical protein